jgi:hypothetical protein
MNWGLIAIAAIQAGFAIYQQQEAKAAASQAKAQAASNLASNQNKATLEQQRERREAQGVVQRGSLLGGNAQANVRAQSVSQRGSILTSDPKTRSLLGG